MARAEVTAPLQPALGKKKKKFPLEARKLDLDWQNSNHGHKNLDSKRTNFSIQENTPGLGAPFPHFIASFPVNSDMFFISAYMKLLPPRSAHSYQQDSQSNTAGPLNLQGEPPQDSSPPPQHSSRAWPSSSQHTALNTLESRQDGLVWPKPPLSTATQVLQWSQLTPTRVTNAGYVKERDGWRQLDAYPQHLNRLKPHVLHIHCLHFGKSL